LGDRHAYLDHLYPLLEALMKFLPFLLLPNLAYAARYSLRPDDVSGDVSLLGMVVLGLIVWWWVTMDEK